MSQARPDEKRKKHRGLACAALAAALLASCGSADGPTISQSDREAGADMHPQLLAEFGGKYEGDEAQYLRQVASGVAATAGLGGRCTFTLVNSDVVNAFAVPGCYIYVTRGMMGIVNSEAELAAVLAHELGHIVGRHSQRQQRRSLWRTLGVIAVSLTGSEQLTQIAGAAAGLFTLRYSRKQEFEADDLGLRFLHQSGYDPHASVDMLQALGRHESFMQQTRGRDEARSIPEWARTHPLTEGRVARANQGAQRTGVASGALPEKEAQYLAAVDGMLYGDDPEQGFVIGRSFAHPVMRIAFEAPEGFTLTNSPQAILLEGPDGMRGEFSGRPLPPGGLQAYSSAVLQQLLGNAQVDIGDASTAVVNGVPALITRGRAAGREGNLQLTLAAYNAGGAGYHFIMLSDASAPAALERLLRSFRTISADEARTLRPREIDTVRVGAGDTAPSLARRMATSNQLGHFLMLNGREQNQPLRPGEPVKLVVYRTLKPAAPRPAGSS